MEEMKFQIGKNGITEGTIMGLDNALKTHKRVRISVFKSAGRDRESIQLMAQNIQEKLKLKTVCKIIGFTIILRRKGN